MERAVGGARWSVRASRCRYLVGFDVDMARMSGSELHLTAKIDGFKEEVYQGGLRTTIVTEETRPNFRLKCAPP